MLETAGCIMRCHRGHRKGAAAAAAAAALLFLIDSATSFVPPSPGIAGTRVPRRSPPDDARVPRTNQPARGPSAARRSDAEDRNAEKSERSDDVDVDVARLEREVMASVRAEMDARTVADALRSDSDAGVDRSLSSSMGESWGVVGGDRFAVSGTSEASSDSPLPSPSEPPSAWRVAFAAGLASASMLYWALHSFVLSSLAFVVVFVVASGDPLEEEGAAGALARVVGRATLKSIETTRPKVKAVARAALSGDAESIELRRRVRELEEENADLRLRIARRDAVDIALPKFTLDELRGMARRKGLRVGGSKARLLLRLIENGAVDLPGL